MTITFPGQRTLAQNNKIWGLVQRLSTYAHLDGEEVMRDLCLQTSGQPSSKSLSVEQADKVIEELEVRVKKARQDALSKKEGEPPDPDAFHTQDQMDMMLCLFHDLGWTTNAQQQGFYRRILAHKRQGMAIFPHTRGEMRKVTEALKAIFTRKYNRQELMDKVRGLLQGPGDRGQGTGIRGDSNSPGPEPEAVQGLLGVGCEPHVVHSAPPPGSESRVGSAHPTEWEIKFLRNLQEKLLLGRKLTPQMIRKLEEVCEKRGQGLVIIRGQGIGNRE